MASANQWSPSFPPQPPQPPRQRTPGTILLWVIAAGLCVALIPLLLITARMRDEATGLQATLTVVQQAMTSVPTPAPDVQQLATALAQVQDQAGQIQAIYPTLVAPRPDWRAVMAAINNYDPNQIALASLTQTGNQIEISGWAVNDTAVAAYSQRLEASGRFARVVIQSMHVVAAPTATATPPQTPTVTATPSPTPSATPNAQDAFEPDDVQPRPIFLGQPQVHTFFPNGDTDTVTFLAKAGRTYRVYTTDLAPGVDTVLAVIVGSLTYTNDDVSAGTLRSEIVFQAGGADANVVARVTNREAYGSDKRYTLAVEEIVLTPTPTPSPTATPTPTSTPTATPTTSAMRARRAPGVAAARLEQSFTIEFTLLVEVKVSAP